MTTATEKATHTSGPWVQHDTEYCPEEIWGDLDGPLEDGKVHGTLICTIADGPAAEANSSLIRSATELLEAAKFAASVLEANLLVELSEKTAHQKLLAAIARAEGKDAVHV